MPLTPEEQRELDQLEFEKLSAEKAASVNRPSATPSPAGLPEVSPDQPKLSPKAQALKDIGWENLGAMERLELMARAAPDYAKKELLGLSQEGAGFGARAAGPAIGHLLGRLSRIPLADRFLGAIGGGLGEVAGEAIEGEQPSLGRIGGATLSGAFTGKGLANPSVRAVGAEAVKNSGINVAAKTAETVVDDRRLPTASEVGDAVVGGVAGTVAGHALDNGVSASSAVAKELKKAPAQKIVDEAKKKGYVFLPSKLKDSAGADAADFFGGSSSNSSGLANIATIKNQEVTNDLARAYVKAPPDMPLDEYHIGALFHAAEQPYRNMADISPQAAADLEMFKQSNSDAKKAWRAYDRNPSPEQRKIATDYESLAEMAEQDMMDEAIKAGKPERVAQLKKARVELAKLHLLDRAMNYGDYNVSAKTFSTAFEHGAKLSDEAELIAKMHLAFPGIMRDASTVTSTGAGKLPAMGAAVRGTVFSPVGQKVLTGKKPEPSPLDFLGDAARAGAMSEGREKESSRK